MDEWFDQLYRENIKQLRNAAKSQLGDQEWAEDVVHDVFLLLLKKRDEVYRHEFVKGWLYKTLANMIRNERKKCVYRQHIPLQDIRQLGIEDTYDMPLAEILPAELAPEDRDILIMRFEKQLSHAQIAQQLGCSPSASRTKLSRAVVRCRELLSGIRS